MSVIVWPGEAVDIDMTIPADVDISAATIQVAVGAWDVEPSDWLTPATLTFSDDKKTAYATLRVGSGAYLPTAARYFPWWRVVVGGVTRTGRILNIIDVRDTTGTPLGSQRQFSAIWVQR